MMQSRSDEKPARPTKLRGIIQAYTVICKSEIIGGQVFQRSARVAGNTVELIVKIKRLVVDIALRQTQLRTQGQKLTLVGAQGFVISHGNGNLRSTEIHNADLVVKKHQTQTDSVIAVIFSRRVKTQISGHGKGFDRVFKYLPPLIPIDSSDPVTTFKCTGQCRVEGEWGGIKLRKMLVLRLGLCDR